MASISIEQEIGQKNYKVEIDLPSKKEVAAISPEQRRAINMLLQEAKKAFEKMEKEIWNA